MGVLEEKIKAFLDVGNGIGYGYGIGNGYDIGYGIGYGYGSGYGDGIGNGIGNGNGYGIGYGDGIGNGIGNGYDIGYGIGYGYGYGNGIGYGDGIGNGIGNGYDIGYGIGYGYGYGNGSGYGDGIKQFNGMDVHIVDDTPTIITNIKGQIASGYTIRNNTQLVPCYIARVGNYFGHGEDAHSALAAATEKYEENRPLSDRIDDFVKEFPTLQTEANVKTFYDWHHILTGSCEFGREEFRKRHNLSFDEVHTVEWFLDIVKNDYGREAIAETRKRYER